MISASVPRRVRICSHFTHEHPIRSTIDCRNTSCCWSTATSPKRFALTHTHIDARMHALAHAPVHCLSRCAGSGKTLAYVLPAVHGIGAELSRGEDAGRGTEGASWTGTHRLRALVVVPTRELVCALPSFITHGPLCRSHCRHFAGLTTEIMLGPRFTFDAGRPGARCGRAPVLLAQPQMFHSRGRSLAPSRE